MTLDPDELIDVDELPDHPIDFEVYRQLLGLIDFDAANAAGASGEFVPPDMEPDPVHYFRFHIDGEWFVWHFCESCKQWERLHKQPQGGRQ